MNQWVEWLSMGGYASYVWTAYGLVSTVLVLNGLALKRQKARTARILQQWFKT